MGGRLVFFYVFSSLQMTSLAQDNLVPNGSFEEYSSCPTGNDLNNGQLERAIGWWNPTLGTSDYFNACNTNGIVDVPNNIYGNQLAFDGNGFVGIGLISWNTDSTLIERNEYVQCKLLQPLKPCTEYTISINVSLAETSSHAMRQLGVVCTTGSIGEVNDRFINVQPSIVNNTIINDTSSWVKISDTFIAKGGEEFLTIGYFSDEITNDTLLFNDTGIDTYFSYYYVDSVSLIEGSRKENCEIVFPNVFTPNNDGVNDIYDLSMLTSFENINCFIVNRWGNFVYTFSHENPFWGGSDQNGLDCKEGVYYLVFKGEKYSKTQFVQLVR